MKPVLFLFPIIAVVAVGILYLKLLKNTIDKKGLYRFLLIILLIAFVLNLIWELVQLPLYQGGMYSIGHIAFCTLAAVADAILALLLYLIFVFILQNLFWIHRIKWPTVLMVVLVGGICAILSEIRQLSIGSWSYTDTMPIIPIVKVGLLPTLQFMLLPMLIYRLSFFRLPKKLVKTRPDVNHL